MKRCMVVGMILAVMLGGAWDAWAGHPYAAWAYRRTIFVDNPNAAVLTNHQIQVTLDTATPIASNKMLPDGGDLRFSTPSGDSLNYWIVPGSINTATTLVWVKTQTLPASGIATIYAHYGQPLASPQSSAPATLDFFDDFDGTTLDTNIWVINSSNYTVANGALRINAGAVRTVDLPFNLNDGYLLEGAVMYHNLSAYYSGTLTGMGPGNYTQGSNSGADANVLLMRAANSRVLKRWVSSGSAASYNILQSNDGFTSAENVWYTLGIGYHADGVTLLKDSSANGSYSFSWAKNSIRITLGAFAGDSVQIQNTSYGWVRVRKYAAVEPSATMSSEEVMGPLHTISGRVSTFEGQGLDNIKVLFSPNTYAVTTQGGLYTLSIVPSGWSGSLIAMLSGDVELGRIELENVQSDLSGQDIVWQSTGLLARGGDISDVTVSGIPYRVHTFTNLGEQAFEVLAGEGAVEYLIVGGGGGGGSRYGGGGGAGGLLQGFMSVDTSLPYSVQVGDGGLGNGNSSLLDNGTSGQPSRFGSLEALGGGGGGSLPGGSGGGAPDGSGGAGTPGQGHAGGVYISSYTGAGGGGAGAPGQDSQGKAGAGGDGLSSMITGVETWYAGGGGGGAYQPSGVRGPGGAGGLGGGGAGSGTAPGSAGQPNTGGGGGGGNTLAGGNGGGYKGGSGIVVVRYPHGALTLNGRVTNAVSGVGMAGVEVATDDGTSKTITYKGGFFSLPVPAGWSGTVRIDAGIYYQVAPSSRSYNDVQSTLSDQNFAMVPEAWALPSWYYRQKYNLSNSLDQALVHHQVEIEVLHQSGMAEDYRDLRFTDENGTTLPHWIERSSTSTATVWVKVPVLAASTTTELMLYYGNPSATNVADGEAVFRFFDDFEDGEIDPVKWPSQAGVGTYLFETNGVLQVNRVAGANVHLMSPSFTTSDLPMVVESRAKTVTLPTNGWIPLGLWLSSTRWIGFLHHPGPRLYAAANAWGSYVTRTLTDFHRLGIAFVSTDSCEMRAVFYDSPAQNMTTTMAYTPWGEEAYAIRLVPRYNYSTAQGMNGQIDAVWVREYATLEPAVSSTDASQHVADAVPMVTISGRVVNASSGHGEAGVTMQVSHVDGSLVTDDEGWYRLEVPAGWAGTIQAQADEGIFTPPILSVGPVVSAMQCPVMVWTRPPTITTVTPGFGSSVGGETIHVQGSNFLFSPNPPSVFFNQTPAARVSRVNATTLAVVTPAWITEGQVSIHVVNSDGQSAGMENAFIFGHPAPELGEIAPTHGPSIGGTIVQISGNQFRGEAFVNGTGRDGDRHFIGYVNLNTSVVTQGRSAPDAAAYSVVSLDAMGAVLHTNVSSDAFSPGDEALLINLQGTSSSIINVGVYEFVRIAAVNGNQVVFELPKQRWYGEGEANDLNIGTNALQQKVMLQRVPHYRDVVVDSDAVLTPMAWDGERGGVLCFRVNGVLENQGRIHADGVGYRGPLAAHGEGLVGWNQSTVYGGGERGYISSKHIGGGGGGGHVLRGIGGYASIVNGSKYSDGGGNAGAGGQPYTTVDPGRIYLGAGGGGHNACRGGAGGGLVMLAAHELINSGLVTSRGSAGEPSNTSSTTGPGGGGAGGTVLMQGDKLLIGENALDCAPGAGGYGYYSGNVSGGRGGEGKLILQFADVLEGSLNAVTSLVSEVTRTRVYFGDEEGVVVEVSDSYIKALTPPHAPGSVDVTVWNPNGQLNTRANAFFYMPSVTGRVTNQITGVGMEGVVFYLNGIASATSRFDGVYALPVTYGQEVIVSAVIPPTLGTGVLTPASRSLGVLIDDAVDQDFSWLPDLPVISGRVINEDTEQGLEGAMVALAGSGWSNSGFTGPGGVFSFTVPYAWTGTVTYSYSSTYGPGTMTPPEMTFSNVTLNEQFEVLWKPPYVPGIRYVSLTGENEYPYTNALMAARDIQTAINSAGPGDMVYVLPGRYDITKAVTLNKPIIVRSTGNATNTVIRRVSGNTGVAYLTSTNAVLDGFTLEGGVLRLYYYWIADKGYGTSSGAGVHNGAVIQNCIIRHNLMSAGHGGRGAGLFLTDSSKAINCVIYGNTSQYFDWTASACASGVRLDSESRLINCVVSGNAYTWISGGAVLNYTGTGYIENSIIWGNNGYYNNALRAMGSGTLVVRASTFENISGNHTIDEDCMQFDPLFVSAATRDYQLRPESLALQTGVDAYNPLTNDILRRPRRVGAIDRGPYEYSEVLPRIIGRVTNEYTGAGWAGVTMTFEGLTNVTSQYGGWFGSLVPDNWSGLVTPSFPTGFFLHPPQRAYTSVTGEVNQQFFNWRPPHPFISGRIFHQNLGTGIDGITVSFANNGGSTVTTNGGYYAHIVTGRWNGTVSPAYAVGGSFTPTSTTFANVITNQYNKNFTWIPVTRPVSGRITHAYTGAGVDGATINFPGSVSVVSAGGGYYVANVYYNYSGQTTPMLAGGRFTSPASRIYDNITEAHTAQDYVWTPNDPVISGRITNRFTHEGQQGIVVTFSAGGGAATTGVDGAYSHVLPWNWSGNATPSFAVGVFDATARTYENVQLPQTNQHYTWTPDARLISGRISHLDTGSGLGGITVTCLPYNPPVVTDAGGQFSITSFWGWSGTIEAEAPPGGTFLTAIRTINDLRQDLASQDFVWAPDRVLSGRVVHEDTGAGMEGVTLAFTGGGGTTTTGADGQFSKTLPHGWVGAISASFTSGSFTPSSRAQTALTAPRSGQDFTWLPPRTLAGRLLNEDTGVGLSGVALYRGTNRLATTGSDGSYQFTVLQGWSATVTPEAIGGAWLPVSRAYADVQLNQAGQDYTWRPPRSVMGRITNMITGQGVGGVTLTFSGGAGTASTGSDGYYMASIRQGWTGTITPAKNGFTFAPGSRSLPELTTDQDGLDFAGTPTTVAIAGRITHAYTGEPVNKFGLSFSNGGGTTLTGTNGEYSVNVPYGWSGTVSFGDPHGTASPVGRSYTMLEEPRAGQNYVWTPVPRTISGVITNTDTGDPAAYVTLVASGGLSVETDEAGGYTLDVYHGWTGAWAPELDGILAPASRAVTNLATSLSAQDFSWTPPRSLSGRLTEAATGASVSGATIGLIPGTSSTSDEAGYFELLANKGWSGTVVASMPGFVFLPLDYTISDLQDSRADLDFERHIARMVTGRVTNYYTGLGVSDMVVIFENLSSVTTDVSGAYAYPVWHGWNGSIQVTSPRGGYFTPALRTLPSVTADVSGQNFAWLPADPVISGRITNIATGAGVGGLVINFSDGIAVTSEVNGVYQRRIPRTWSGTWTAVAATGTIEGGTSYAIENITDNQGDFDFAWLPPDPVVSGRITHQTTGLGIDGLNVTLGNYHGQTANGGYYRIAVPLYWSGTGSAEPVDSTGRYNPATRTYTRLVTDAANQHYQWQAQQTISGIITNYYSGDGVPGVMLTASGTSGTTTDEAGAYTIVVPPSWSGVVSPMLASGALVPTSRTYNTLSSSPVNQNFSWTPPPAWGTRFVAPGGGHIYPYTNWSMAATNIHTALRASNPGETIWVSNGVYDINVTLLVDKPIRLRSVNGPAFTIVSPARTNDYRLLHLNHANAVVSGFTLENAAVTGAGAGAYVQQGYLHSSVIRGNKATSGAGGVQVAHTIAARVSNLLVAGNTGSVHGGISGDGVVINCTVYDNEPNGLKATLVYNSIADGPVDATETRFTLAPQFVSGSGNLTGVPSLVDRAAGDYRLADASLGIDQGMNDYMVLPLDADFRPRVLNVVDMGAFEWRPPTGLALALSGEPNPLPQGQIFTYYLTVINAGPDVASGIVVTSSVPAGFLYLSNNLEAAYMNGIWNVGLLGVGEGRTLELWAEARTTGVWTNWARIIGGATPESLPDYLEAHYVATVLGEVVITNLAASTSSGNSTVEWDSVVGVGYSIYSSDEAYAPAMEPRWDERATMVASEEVRHFMDADTPSGQVTTRYYHVTYSGTQPAATNLWALIRKDIKGGAFTLLSPPVRLDRAFDGEMGRMLAEQLNGHDGGSAAGADEVFIFQPDGSWRNLYLDGKRNWCEANGEPSRYELAEGHGFFVARRSAGASRVTFAGRVGNDGTASVEIKPGFNLLGLSEGKSMPLKQTLAAIQPVGAAIEDEADQLIIQQANGAWRRLMYIQGWGAPYDGNWFDLQTFSIVSDGELLPPGAAYYYLRRGPATTVSF